MGGICCWHMTAMLVRMRKCCMPNSVVIILFIVELWPFVNFYSKPWNVLGWKLPWAISEREMFNLILLKLYGKVLWIRTLYTHTQNLLRNDLFWQALLYCKGNNSAWSLTYIHLWVMALCCIFLYGYGNPLSNSPTPVICYIYIFY